MYSFSKPESKKKMTAKGIKKSFVKHHIRHEMYLHTLQTKTITHANFRNFRSTSHKLETVHFYKKYLSAYDDKRYVLSDGISTLAYGHYKINSR